jgi:hypothetical protein
VNSYIALPQREQQPWTPSQPGEHGLMVFPAGASAYATSYEVFVLQIAEEHKYRYIGQYAPTKAKPLDREDWLNLHEKVRSSENVLSRRICCPS